MAGDTAPKPGDGETVAEHAKAAVADATERAAAILAAVARETKSMRQTIEAALNEAGVDTSALADHARERLTTLEKMASEELARRPLRALAIEQPHRRRAFGALVAR